MTRTEQLLREGLIGGAYSGAALSVGSLDQPLLQVCVGAVSGEEGAAPVTPSTLFDMASISKVLSTTFVAFHLIESGQLSLLDYVSEHIENWPEDKKDITIYHLMTHTSGIPAEIHLWKNCQDPSKIMDEIRNTPLAYPTGQGVAYSCIGFILLGKIMEKITGKSLHELSQEYVFKPIGMNSTGYRPLSLTKPDPAIAMTEVMTLSGPGKPGVVHDENARFLDGVSGNAGIFSCLSDMEKFAMMLSHQGSPLISKRLFEIATQNYTKGLDENRGLGFQLSGPEPTFFGDLFGNSGIGHTGYTGTSLAVDLKSGLWVVLLTNRVYPTRNNGKLTRLRHLIHNAAVKEFLR